MDAVTIADWLVNMSGKPMPKGKLLSVWRSGLVHVLRIDNVMPDGKLMLVARCTLFNAGEDPKQLVITDEITSCLWCVCAAPR